MAVDTKIVLDSAKVKKFVVIKTTVPVYSNNNTLAKQVMLLTKDQYVASDQELNVKGVKWRRVGLYQDGIDTIFMAGWVLSSGLKQIEGTIDEYEEQKKRDEIAGNLGDGVLDREIVNALINDAVNNSSRFDASTRLFGQPFQFSKNTDLRVFDNDIDIGRKYLETFIGEAPIVSILPGASNFLPGLSQDEKDGIMEWFRGAGAGGNHPDNTSYLEEILAGENRYFDFLSDYTSYMKYVNLMCRMSAIYMGIGERSMPLNGVLLNQYQYFDWKNYKYSNIMSSSTEEGEKTVFEKLKDLTDQITMENLVSEVTDTLVGAKNYVQFYVDPSSSFQETSNNQTAQSSLASFFDSAQGISKEMHFYKEMLEDGGLMSGTMNALGTVGSAVGDVTSTFANALSGGLLTKLFGASKTVINGGNVMFPEIWGDSNYQKSYSVDVNLVSPYGTKESVYLHVLVPLFHLMALSLPRQITANGFANPFLVRVTCKGWFNCEMGMVDSISIEKVQGSYTVNGIPTEIRVSLSIRDLYSDLMITPSTKPGLFYANRGLSNWLAVTSGIDVAKPATIEKWEGIMKALLVQPTEITDVYSIIKERIRNITSQIVDF